MVTRKIAKLLRGKATGPQVAMAAFLGCVLGFVPGFFLVEDLGGGFMQAPGLILSLLFLVLILNANLTVFGLTLAGAKVLSVLALPVSFAVGRFLLDGPTSGLFQSIINAPVLAWFGLHYYATAGGLVVGTVCGAAAAWVGVLALGRFRSVMAGLEDGSERFQNANSKRSVRFMKWLFLGKRKDKRSYREVLDEHRKGLPVRLSGVAVALVLGAVVWFGQGALMGPAMTHAARTGLEWWNGATVDIDSASLDLGAGSMQIKGLAMADAQALDQDILRSEELSISLDMDGFLRRRFAIKTVVSEATRTGAPRSEPGRIVRSAEPTPEPPRKPNEKTLDDYVKEAEKWRGRLEQISGWLEYLSGGDAAEQREDPEARDRRVEEQARAFGYAAVTADHLVQDAPLVHIQRLQFHGVVADNFGGELIDIEARNLSSGSGSGLAWTSRQPARPSGCRASRPSSRVRHWASRRSVDVRSFSSTAKPARS